MREFIVRTDKQNTCDGILTNALQVAIETFMILYKQVTTQSGYQPGCMTILVSEAIKQTGVYSFLAVSSPLSLFQNEERGGSNKEAV